MKKLLLSYCALILFINVRAQDTLDISAQVNAIFTSSQSLKTNNKSVFKVGTQDFILKNVKTYTNGDKTSISANFKNAEGELILKNFEGRISGFIYLPTQQKGYRIEMQNGKVNAIEVPASNIIMETRAPQSFIDGQSAEVPQASTPRYLPIGNNLSAAAGNLQSKAGSPNILYLDFDGESVLGMGYNFYEMKNTNATDDQIRLIWEVVAAEYAAFDINVTTVRSIYDACPVTNKLMCVFGNNSIGGAAGLSFLNIFGTAKASMVSTSASGLGMECGHVASHETGHAFGLSHDGVAWPDPYVEYYGGNSDWAPVMGSKWGWPYKTWSKGEYTNASQKQDDIAIIGNQTGFRADDYSVKSVLIKGVGDSINWQDNNGFIEKVSDVDTFFFEMTNAGKIHLLIGTAVEHTNLDVEAQLLNASFTLVASSNIAHSRNAEFYTNLPAGKYYLLIRGGAEPLYFTTYSSFGYYEITGSIEEMKKADIDIALQSMIGFDERCGTKVSGSIEIKNVGATAVSGGKINLYVDGVLNDVQDVKENILPGAVLTLSNFSVSITGQHQLKAEYVVDAGVSETVIKNNSLVKNYFFENGALYSVHTDLPSYNFSSPFTWNIENMGSGATVADGKTLAGANNNGIISQDFCLQPDCYHFYVKGDFNVCTQYKQFQQGGTYVGGDIVAYNGKVYSAKWWTQTTPPSSNWTLNGNCNSGSYSITLNNMETNKEEEKISSDTYNSGTMKMFCVENLNTGTGSASVSELNVYPNPGSDIVNIRAEKLIQAISIYDITGKEITSKYINASVAQMNVFSWVAGVYVIKVKYDNNEEEYIRMLR